MKEFREGVPKEDQWEHTNKSSGVPIHKRHMRRHGSAPKPESLAPCPINNTFTPSPGHPPVDEKTDSSLEQLLGRE